MKLILSRRLEHIAGLIPRCQCLADIGTDHGYIPIYSVLNRISERAIASDINIGPIESARLNIKRYGLTDKIETRIGSGLSTIDKGEADVIVIAGMGGALIGDIIKENLQVSKESRCLILQPVQYPEILRKHLIENKFKIIDEDMVKDENKLYHIIKTESGEEGRYEKEAYYYTGKVLIEKGHPLLREFLHNKISVLSKILSQLSEKEQPERYNEVHKLLGEFQEVVKCL